MPVVLDINNTNVVNIIRLNELNELIKQGYNKYIIISNFK